MIKFVVVMLLCCATGNVYGINAQRHIAQLKTCNKQNKPCLSRADRQCGVGIPSCLGKRHRAPATQDYANVKTYHTNDEVMFDLQQSAPEYATVGQPYPIQITITAKQDCDNVSVTQQLPDDVEMLKSDPRASCCEKNRIVWEFPHMSKGETRCINLWIKPLKEGCCLAAATVLAARTLTAFTYCGQANLCCCVQGPECACIDRLVPYTIEIVNKGTAVARNVIVENFIPAGLAHASGNRTVKFQIGDICPGDSKSVAIDLMAIQGGPNKNLVNITYEGGSTLSCSADTWINTPCLQVTQNCSEVALVGKPTNYCISVTNTGDILLRDIVLDTLAPQCGEILSAPGAKVWSNRAMWSVLELEPGETRTFVVTVRVDQYGTWNNHVIATAQCDYGPFSISSDCTTAWEGIPATHMCVVDTQDPLCIGDVTVYHIAITNRGTGADYNVQVTVRFSGEVQPENAHGPTRGNVGRNSVTFAPIPCLDSKETIEYTISARGIQCGTAKVEAIVTSDAITAPVSVTETTRIY